jgi:hypothetical protein
MVDTKFRRNFAKSGEILRNKLRFADSFENFKIVLLKAVIFKTGNSPCKIVKSNLKDYTICVIRRSAVASCGCCLCTVCMPGVRPANHQRVAYR